MLELFIAIVGIFVAAVGAYEGIDYVRHRLQLAPVDSYDVEGMLRKRNLWKPFKDGEILCAGCGEPVSFGNLGTIVRERTTGKLDLVCRKPTCLSKYMNDLEMKMWDAPENAS